MLKKRLGTEAIEREWYQKNRWLNWYFKVSSTLILPEDCRNIGSSAFEGCVKLRKVIIPGNVVEYIGRCAFDGCKNLRKVVIPESVVEIGSFAFYGCINATIILKKPTDKLKFLGRSAFNGCKNVKEKTRT